VSVPFILAPGEKHPDAPPLERPFFRFASGQTGGLATLAEVRLPPLTAGPNLHVHTREDELFFVLGGVMTVQVGDQLQEIAAGGLAWGTRGIPHAFANRAKDPAAHHDHVDSRRGRRALPGHEGVSANRWRSSGPQVVADLQARYGATHVGPPIPIPGP
jgi:quercetin dioxygenase-like cupin family protein